MGIAGAQRTRTLFALAVLAGVCAAVPGTFILIGELAVPAIFGAFGAITGVPVAALLWREVGPARALGLAGLTAAAAALLIFALGFGACATSSCAG